MKFGAITKIWLLAGLSVVPLFVVGWNGILVSQKAFTWLERAYNTAEEVQRASQEIGTPISRLRQLSLEIVLAPNEKMRQKLYAEQKAVTEAIEETFLSFRDEELSGGFALLKEEWNRYRKLKDHTVNRSVMGYREEAFINVMDAEDHQFETLLKARHDWSRAKIANAKINFEQAKIFKTRMIQVSLILILVTTGLLAIFATLIARSIVKPIEILKNASLKIQRKEKVEHILPHSKDELGELGRSMEQMAKAIQANTEELEKKNEELDQFAYTVSHDLKSPLVTIQGFLGLVEESASTGKVEQMKSDMGRIDNAVDKMRLLLDELLSMSRAGRRMNEPEEIALSEVVGVAVENVMGQIRQKHVEIIIAPNLPLVVGDRIKLIQLYQNLIDNAIKYMGVQTQPRVEVGYNGRAFFVKDNGKGIDPKYHEKVFQLFYKLDQSTPGSGIGTALVKRIVESHGGKVWVESDGAGTGSTFYFTLNISGAGHEQTSLAA